MKADKENAVEGNKPIYIKRQQVAGHSGPWLTSCGVLTQLKISALFKTMQNVFHLLASLKCLLTLTWPFPMYQHFV